MKRKGPVGSSYPDDWKRIAGSVKDAADWKCVRCGHAHEPAAGYTLTVHHLDIDPANCAWWNIPALCQRCHLKIQSKVVMERPYMFDHSEWFKPYVAAYRIGPKCGYDDSLAWLPPAWVRKHADNILSLVA